jgi:predicted hotdog family 3-hydroxylacyl-ACP dehydratase
MKVGKDQIEAYLPHRAPFIMVDNLIDATENRFETNFQVLPENIFLEDGKLREFALIENIAQSSAAGIAFLNRSASSKPKDGLIGGISKLIVHAFPKVNDKIYTVVIKLHQLGNMYLLRGENYADDQKLIECEIKLVAMR